MEEGNVPAPELNTLCEVCGESVWKGEEFYCTQMKNNPKPIWHHVKCKEKH